MSSIMTYGGLVHTANEVNLESVSKKKRYSQRNRVLTIQESWDLSGELIYSTPATIMSTAQAIVTAYASDYQNASYTVGGTVAHALNNGVSLSGVKVLYTSFPKGDYAQLATTRSFRIKLYSEYPAVEDDLVSWQEAVETVGNGGLKYYVVDTFVGPVAVITAFTSAVYYTQTGQAVGFSDYPVPPGPVNPVSEMGFRRRITKISGRQQGTGIRFYTTKWAYYMVRDPNTFGSADFLPTSR